MFIIEKECPYLKHFGCPSSKRYHKLGRLFSLTAVKSGCFHSGPKGRCPQVLTSNAPGFTYGLIPNLLAQHYWKIGSQGFSAKVMWIQLEREDGALLLWCWGWLWHSGSCLSDLLIQRKHQFSADHWEMFQMWMELWKPVAEPQRNPSGSHPETTCQVQSPYFAKEKTEALETYWKQQRGLVAACKQAFANI